MENTMKEPLFYLLLLPWGVLILSSTCGCQRSESVRPSEKQTPEAHSPAAMTRPGTGDTIRLSPEALQTLTLRTAPVERRPLTEEVRVTAVIKPNENRLAHVSPRIAGRVVEVRKLLGDTVKTGDVLA